MPDKQERGARGIDGGCCDIGPVGRPDWGANSESGSVRRPPPPPDDRGVTRHGGLGNGVVAITGAAFVVMLILTAGLLMQRETSERRALMGQCIEFHSVDRCRDLYLYGRQDLMVK